MFEIFDRTGFPYSAVVFVVVRWKDGSGSSGSGVVVGVNDVLTAAHVVYDRAKGGWASSVTLYPGADTKPKLDTPFGEFGNGWRISVRDTDWDRNGNGLVTDSEAQYDLALIGLHEPIGNTTGWLGTRNERIDGPAIMVGYPGRGTGMMAEQVYADASSRYGVYNLDSGLGPGSSGGPLVRTAANGQVYVVGVASSGSENFDTSTYAALFGPGTWEWLDQALDTNDDLMAGRQTSPTAPSPAPVQPAAPALPDGTGGVVAPVALTKAYVAYFGRPVDASGVAYFAGQPLEVVAAVFDGSQESRDLYGANLAQKINAIYKNLFNREAELAGLQHWMAMVSAGRVSAPGAALAILDGAVGMDKAAILNKLSVADAFSRALDTPAELAGYAGLAAANSAKAFLAAVNGTVASLEAGYALVNSAVVAAVAAGTQRSTAATGLAVSPGLFNDPHSELLTADSWSTDGWGTEPEVVLLGLGAEMVGVW